jgi:hypothetical protein
LHGWGIEVSSPVGANKLMPGDTAEVRQMSSVNDPTVYFIGGDAWSTQLRYRYVPPKHLQHLDLSDPGLECLLYLQFLISEEVGAEARELAMAAC